MMQVKKRKIKMCREDKIFVIINAVLLAVIFVVTLYPLIFVLSASFSDPTAVTTGKMWLLPVEPTLHGYRYILKYHEIWTGYGNTIFYTVFGTLVNLALTLPCAYGLSRRDIKGRGAIMTFFLITMYVGGGMIPTYLNIYDLGLLDTRAVMLLTSGLSVYNMIVARTFYANTIPWELHEAAFIDGASDWYIFLKIVTPLSKPIMVVMVLYYGVMHWNSWFSAFLYLHERSLLPLQVILKEILTQSKFVAEQMTDAMLSVEDQLYFEQQANTANMLKYVVIVVSTVPMLAIYPWLQKFFAKGVMIGSVKG